MRQILNGSGIDVTATVVAWLRAHKTLHLAHLYLIGETDDPMALWLTDWESPLCWPNWGTFLSTTIKRGSLASKIGLEAESLEVSWSPRNAVITSSMGTASYYQLARLGWFDNKRLRVWRCYMPAPGDANTFGAMELFGGFIGSVLPSRGLIQLTANDYRYVLNQKVPTGLIEVTNTLASYTGGTPPSGYSSCPQFAVLAGSNTTVLHADQTSPSAGSVPGTNSLNDGYVVFSSGACQGLYSIIGRNSGWLDTGSHNHTQIQLMSPLPWAPQAGDMFYVSAASPINQSDGDYYGFPYVPAPETAV
jgi:hypothetical protein